MLKVVEQGIVKIQQGISSCVKLMQDCLETGWSKEVSSEEEKYLLQEGQVA